MATRGRPRKNGLQPAWMLGRVIMVISAFNEARQRGEKYEAAIDAAIEAVKAFDPKMRIGPRRVKQILADWQPKGSSIACIARRLSDAEVPGPKTQELIKIFRSLGVVFGEKVSVYSIGIGPRPEYRR